MAMMTRCAGGAEAATATATVAPAAAPAANAVALEAAKGSAPAAAAAGDDWCHVAISEAPLDTAAAIAYVTVPAAGGVSVFIGTTRDSFEGKVVTRLEYEAYEPMALRELRAIAAEARARWGVLRVAVLHRTGVVPVTHASVVIAVGSAHRGEGLDAVRYLIDTLKARVPIWKREFYAGDDAVWKENREWAAGAAAAVAAAPAAPPVV